MPNDHSPPLQPQQPAAALVPASLQPRTLEEAMKFARVLSQSDIIPKDYVGKEANVLVAVQWGMELGLQPLQAMQNIAVINGRPSLWGDSVIALVRSSPLCEWIKEEPVDNGWRCTTKRRGEEPQSRTFTKADAETAKLLSKDGPWKNYPQRMLQMRARAWCLRDVYPDVLRGMPIAEEVMDIPPMKDVTPQAEVVMPREKAAPTNASPAEPDQAKPTEEPRPVEGEVQTAEEQKKAAEQLARARAEPAKPSQIALIRTKAKQATITEAEIAKRFALPEADPLAGISVEMGNAILKWLANPTGE